MNRVFVVQRPCVFDPAEKKWRDKYDLSPAEQFGEIVYMLGPKNLFHEQLDGAKAKIRAAIAGEGQDYLLAVGDPVAIALAMRVISEERRPIQLLKWDRKTKCYLAFNV